MNEKHYYKDEIKRLLILYTVSFIVASTLVMFIFIGLYTNTIVRRNNNRANAQIANHLEEAFSHYINFIDELSESPLLTAYIKEQRNPSDLFQKLYEFNNERGIKSIFYVVDTEGNTIITNNYVESPYSGVEIFVSGLFKQMKSEDDIVFMNNKIQIDLTKRTIYSIGKRIVSDGQVVGYLVFDILEQDVNNVIQSSDVDILVITDQYNNSILSTNSLILDEIGKLTIIKSVDEMVEFMDKRYYFNVGNLLEEQVSIYTFTELDLIYDMFITSVLFMLAVMVIIIIIIFRAAEFTAKNKTKSINDLITGINGVKSGNFDHYVTIETGDEFQVIGDQFNIMLDDLNEQISINDELKEREKMAVIKQLEAQFNPHFIFNTLEILKYLIHISVDKSTELVVNFASLLRYSIDYEKKHILLKEDLDYIRSYLLIQKMRYNKRLSYNIQFDEKLSETIVPKLIMQPIIENCIIHGYRGKEYLEIDISITSSDDKLRMTITDNGDGITEDKLQTITSNLNSDRIANNSIGLNNIHRRLKLLYGDEYGLKIQSEHKKFTSVIIELPIETMQNI